MGEIIAATTRLSLEHLMATDPIALFELVSICRDSQHELWGDYRTKLEVLALLDYDGRPHDAVRDAVLANVVGDGLEMRLR